MKPTIFDVQQIGAGRLFVMARTVAGEFMGDEFLGLRKSHIDHVVSLLEYDESAELELGDEEARCRKHDMCFASFQIPDRGCPDADAAMTLAGSLANRIDGGGDPYGVFRSWCARARHGRAG